MSSEWIPDGFVDNLKKHKLLSHEVAKVLHNGKDIPKLSEEELLTLVSGGSQLLGLLVKNDMSITEFVQRVKQRQKAC